MMWQRTPRRRFRPRRNPAPRVEALDARELLSAVPAPRLGSYLAPGTAGARPSQPPQLVGPRQAVDERLSTLLGPALARVQQRASQGGTVRVPLGPRFLQNILNRADTYALLDSPAMSSLIGAEPAGLTAEDADTVTLSFQPQGPYILSTTGDSSAVQVPATPTRPGFVVTVPTSGIRLLSGGLVSVEVPRSAVPEGIDLSAEPSIPTGSLTEVFGATGQLVADSLRSASVRPGPNSPRSVPGLRLASSHRTGRSFPAGAGRRRFLRLLRLAADRDVLNPDAGQSARIAQGLTDFLNTVRGLQAAGAFQPAVPPAPPAAAGGRLAGTLEVSYGVVRGLGTVDPALSGLQLPDVGNVPGRLEVGYVIDRAGDFGLILTARGPLLNASPGIATADRVGGDVTVETSNAPNISALNGLRTVEGYLLGSAAERGLEASRNAGGVNTFAASTGYGTGLEFGTGVAYSQVIPLGNVFALIPSAPRS